MISEKKTSNEIFRNIRMLWDKLEKKNYQDCKYCGNVLDHMDTKKYCKVKYLVKR